MHSCLPCCLHSCYVNVMLITCFTIRCLHDIVAHLLNSLRYLNLLMSCFALPCCYCCCELASTFNVLTWRVMPDLQALLWTHRTTFPVFASYDVSHPVSLWSGVRHRRCYSAAVVVPLLESSTAAWCRDEAS